MSSVSRDSQYRYVPGFQNLPSTKNIPDHLMSDSVALNVSFQEKFSEESIAPSLYLNLPEVGIPEPAIPTLTDKPPSLEKTTPQQPVDGALLPPPSVPSPTTLPLPKPITRIPLPPKEEEINPASNHFPPPPPHSSSTQPKSVLPLPPPPKEEEIKPPTNSIPPCPSNSTQLKSIPPPPPPPPANRPPVNRPSATERRRPSTRPSPVVPPVVDFQTQLFNVIMARRSGLEDEPKEKKADGGNEDEDDWN